MWITVCSLSEYHTCRQRFFSPARTRHRTFRHFILTCQQTGYKHKIEFKSPIKPAQADRPDNDAAVWHCGKPSLSQQQCMLGSNTVEKCDPVLISVLLQIDQSCYKYEEHDKTHFPICSSWTDKNALLTSASGCSSIGSLKYCQWAREGERAHAQGAHTLHRHLKSLLTFIGKVIALKGAFWNNSRQTQQHERDFEEVETATRLKSVRRREQPDHPRLIFIS